MVSLGKNIGFEQSGSGECFSRPVVVIQKINNQMFWCVPLSTKQKALHFYYNFTDPNNQHVSAILGQLKLVSIKRFQREMYQLPWEIFDAIKDGLRALLD
jgi:mRNA-degrading endonuclease toxin of MazEF toxin-antitoxin module